MEEVKNVYFKDMIFATGKYSHKIFTDNLFYIGSTILGTAYYLTGLSLAQLQSILLVIFLDIVTRIWAEKVNKRPILSRRMFTGFAGKFLSYMILFTLAQHSFYLKEIFQYAILGGFSLIEFRSIYENLKDAGQKHINIIGDRINKEINKFSNGEDSSTNSDLSSNKNEPTI
jgi:hypothetical protein